MLQVLPLIILCGKRLQLLSKWQLQVTYNWEPKTRRCTMLGYSDTTTSQYRIWDRNRITIIAASNARFDEQSIGNRDSKDTLVQSIGNWDSKDTLVESTKI